MSVLYYETDYLMHHGILGMKWGIRRFQNKDGSLTSAGRKRYSTDDGSSSGRTKNSSGSGASSKSSGSTGAGKKKMTAEQKKALAKKVAIGVGVTAAVLAAGYGAKKYSDIANFKREIGRRALSEEAYNKTLGSIKRTSVAEAINENWDHYSLKTKNNLLKRYKDDVELGRYDLGRAELTLNDGMKLTSPSVNFARNAAGKHKTLSSVIENKIAQRQDLKEAMQQRKDRAAELKKEAQEAYLNKSSDLRNKVNAYNIADVTSRNDSLAKRAGTRLLAKATQGPTSSDRQRAAERKERASAAKAAKKAFKASPRGMTDDELITVIGRLKKEKEYLDLSSSTDKRSFGREVVNTAGKAAVKTLATAGAIYAGKKTIEKTIDRLGGDGKTVVREMFPKKK